MAPHGRGTTGQGHQKGRLFAGQGRRRTQPRPLTQRGGQPFVNKPLAGPMHGCYPHMEGLGNLLIGGPLRRAQQHMGARHPARRCFALVDRVEQVSLLLCGEVNQIFRPVRLA